MSEITACYDGIGRFADSHTVIGTALGTSGALDQAGNIAAAVPMFGLMGQDFLGTFGVAQANHLSSVLELSNVHTSLGAACHAAVSKYQATEADSSALLGAIDPSGSTTT